MLDSEALGNSEKKLVIIFVHFGMHYCIKEVPNLSGESLPVLCTKISLLWSLAGKGLVTRVRLIALPKIRSNIAKLARDKAWGINCLSDV